MKAKTLKKYSSSKKRKFGKKSKSIRKSKKMSRMNRYKKGGAEETCSMCHKIIINDKPFVPSGCLMKHGKIRAHKICSDCWWNKFAQEGVSHKCPGCESGQPLNKPLVSKVEVIDLTTDD